MCVASPFTIFTGQSCRCPLPSHALPQRKPLPNTVTPPPLLSPPVAPCTRPARPQPSIRLARGDDRRCVPSLGCRWRPDRSHWPVSRSWRTPRLQSSSRQSLHNTSRLTTACWLNCTPLPYLGDCHKRLLCSGRAAESPKTKPCDNFLLGRGYTHRIFAAALDRVHGRVGGPE